MNPQEAIAAPRRRVLVIDDEAAFCSFMARLIGGLGYDVRTRNGLSLVDFADLNSSDVVFLDMMMPNTDGIQVLNALSRIQAKPSLVLMSGIHGEVLATAETIARRSGLQVIGVLSKPFRSQDVQSLLEKHSPPTLRPARKQVASQINIEDVLAGIERNEFDVYLQPIVDLWTCKAISFEALARWHSSKFNLVTPDRFISLAISHGILPRLSRQILHKTLGYSKQLKNNGMVWKVSVNLGVEDLVDHNLPEFLAALVESHELPPNSLTIELTESSASVNEVAMLGTLARLRFKEIDLAIDDFGTSYSGLDRLSTIPFNSLKIDMRFISRITTHENARTIVESSVALAKRLKMKTVAEGVETEDQLALLRKIGCDYGQGFLFARPMDFENLVKWYRTQEMSDSPEGERLSATRVHFA